MPKENLVKRVDAGMKVLIAKCPTKLLELDVNSIESIALPDACILRRLFGGFSSGMVALGLRYGTISGLNAEQLGFACVEKDDAQLTWLWKIRILSYQFAHKDS